MRIVFTPLAERQIDQMHAYITESSGYESRADAYVARIIAFCFDLVPFPERGTRRDDILQGLRLINFERRVTIAFKILEDRVLIEGIFYGGQDVETFYSDDLS